MSKVSEKARVELIAAFGGACQRCGYSKCTRAMHFHHVDNASKKEYGNTGRAELIEVQEHPERFLLLCANCHIEEHDALDTAKQIFVKCLFCGKEFNVKPYKLAINKGKYCSNRCQHDHREAIAQSPEHILERFWKHVVKKDDCWIWQGTMTGGIPTIEMKSQGKYTFLSTSRFAYEAFKGALSADVLLRRKCSTLYCVNPDHFELSSEHGSRGAFNKITDAQVLEIRRKYASGSSTHAAIASEYGIARETVGQIVRYQRWTHVKDPIESTPVGPDSLLQL